MYKLLELDIAKNFCKEKIDYYMTSSFEHLHETELYSEDVFQIEIWNKRLTKINSEIETIISTNYL